MIAGIKKYVLKKCSIKSAHYLFCFSAIRDEPWCGYVVLECLGEVVAVAVVEVGTQVDGIKHPDVSLLVGVGTTT